MKINMLQKYADHLRERARSAFMAKRLMAVFKGEATAADESVDVTDIHRGGQGGPRLLCSIACTAAIDARIGDCSMKAPRGSLLMAFPPHQEGREGASSILNSCSTNLPYLFANASERVAIG
jgi:hypothetical protein